MFERLGVVAEQAGCLIILAWLLCKAKQFDSAEGAGSRAVDLLPEKGEEFQVCEAHRALGRIYQSMGEMKKAIHHLEVALGIASCLNQVTLMFWVNYALAWLFSAERKFDHARAHVEHTKSLAVNNTYLLARASILQARLWYAQDMLGEAKSEIFRVLDVFEKLGAANDSEFAQYLLQQIDARLPVALDK